MSNNAFWYSWRAKQHAQKRRARLRRAIIGLAIELLVLGGILLWLYTTSL